MTANGELVMEFPIERSGLFILEAAVPSAAHYSVELTCSPVWQDPGDGRNLTANFT